MLLLLYILLPVAFLAFLESIYSLVSGFSYLFLFKKFHKRSPGKFAPPVSLFFPCKGLDPGFEANLQAYFEQDYRDYQLLLVTGEEADPCVPVLRRLCEQNPRVPGKILFSGKTCVRGQKVHNLIYALEHVRASDQVFAFGDSDIRPAKTWLQYLVSPLEDATVGLSTGFRWYVPSTGGFASVLRSVWNAGIASLMKERDCFFGWGGAMAVRTQVFESCGALEYWQNALSDDYALSRAVSNNSFSISFQPPCLSFSHEDCTLAELLNWSSRQLAITRVYHPWLWKAAFVTQLFNTAAIWGGGAWVLVNFIALKTVSAGPTSMLLLFFIGSTYVLGSWKAWLRVKSVCLLFADYRTSIHRNLAAYLLGGPLASLVSLFGLFRSLFSRDIEWRGIRYRMLSPNKTVVLN